MALGAPPAKKSSEEERVRVDWRGREPARASKGVLRPLQGQSARAHACVYVCLCVSPEQHVTGVAGGNPFKRVHVEVVKVVGGVLRKDV